MSEDTKKFDANEMIEQFIEKLTIEAGMDKKLDETTLLGLRKDLKERLENRIKAMIISNIKENQLDEFEKILDSKDAMATQKFCNENIANFPELLAAEFVGFRNRYIA